MKNLLLFFTALISAIFFFGSLNILEEKASHLFSLKDKGAAIAKIPNNLENPQELELEKLKPLRNWEIPPFEVSAESALALLVDNQNQQKILFEKNSDKKLPFASLTKLMTAIVAVENYSLDEILTVDETKKEDNGILKMGDSFEVIDLLKFMLIASNNTAAEILAKKMGREKFLSLMTKKAKELGARNTEFFNPTGLDPDSKTDLMNLSTAQDLAKIIFEASKNPTLVNISKTPELTIYSRNTLNPYKISNTNLLLNEIPELKIGKTGFTPKAKGCLILMAKAPNDRGEIIAVVLGADNRFQEMRNLLEWLKKAYIF
jgi:D-alanyl-D-alanine carboxypeptidase (penicillin-binding protein 5/6)